MCVPKDYMNKQRICVVGDGLSGLMTAISLHQVPGIEVSLVSKKGSKKQDKRIVHILLLIVYFCSFVKLI